MSLKPDRRYYPRVPVHWAAIFYTADFFSHGIVVDVNPLAWRLQGPMPVHAGMQVGIRVWASGFPPIEIEEATVVWAKGQQFAIAIDRVRHEDEAAMLRLQGRTLDPSQQEGNGNSGRPCDPIEVYSGTEEDVETVFFERRYLEAA